MAIERSQYSIKVGITLKIADYYYSSQGNQLCGIVFIQQLATSQSFTAHSTTPLPSVLIGTFISFGWVLEPCTHIQLFIIPFHWIVIFLLPLSHSSLARLLSNITLLNVLGGLFFLERRGGSMRKSPILLRTTRDDRRPSWNLNRIFPALTSTSSILLRSRWGDAWGEV